MIRRHWAPLDGAGFRHSEILQSSGAGRQKKTDSAWKRQKTSRTRRAKVVLCERFDLLLRVGKLRAADFLSAEQVADRFDGLKLVVEVGFEVEFHPEISAAGRTMPTVSPWLNPSATTAPPSRQNHSSELWEGGHFGCS
jgi:hypothetical protein